MARGILTIGGRAFVRVGGGDAFAPGDECPIGTLVPLETRGGGGSAFAPEDGGSAFAPGGRCLIGT